MKISKFCFSTNNAAGHGLSIAIGYTLSLVGQLCVLVLSPSTTYILAHETSYWRVLVKYQEPAINRTKTNVPWGSLNKGNRNYVAIC